MTSEQTIANEDEADIMANQSLESSAEFLQTIIDTVPDGERIKFCLQCGACSGVCPFGFAMAYPPHGMITALRAGMLDALLDADTAWMCVACYACTQVCPAKIPVTRGLTTRVKEEMLLAGNIPTELQDALENAQRTFNPLGESPRKRAEWVNELDFEIPLMAKANRPVEVLWFVGDYPSYHPGVRGSTLAMAKILKALDVDFGILGPEEVTDGDSLRLAGESGLFEMMAEKNGSAFEKYEFNEILTSDPHAYNALRNEYPLLGITYPVRHYTQFLVDHIESLKPRLTQTVDATVTYHDPCYLGRVNEIYEEPRQLLGLIPGLKLVEMSHQREYSLCCGGGGGGMWLDGFSWERAEARVSEWRVREAIAALGRSNGSEGPASQRILCVACPYEPPRFEDAIKSISSAEGILVRDIVELLAESMGV